MTTIFDLYDLRGELLDTAAEAAINERPFYLQKSLDDINDQIRLLENVTDEAQDEYFRTDSDSKKWDFTPIPSDMPIIDFDNIPEIPF